MRVLGPTAALQWADGRSYISAALMRACLHTHKDARAMPMFRLSRVDAAPDDTIRVTSDKQSSSDIHRSAAQSSALHWQQLPPKYYLNPLPSRLLWPYPPLQTAYQGVRHLCRCHLRYQPVRIPSGWKWKLEAADNTSRHIPLRRD